MLDLRIIRERPQEVRENAQRRMLPLDVEALLAADTYARQSLAELDETRRQRNAVAKQVGQASDESSRKALEQEGRALKEREAQLHEVSRKAQEKRLALWIQAPNLTHPDVPVGATDADNRVLRTVGKRPEFGFPPRDHVELMEALDWVDFAAAARVSGQKFYYLKNEAVLLEQALVRYALEELQAENFTLFSTPDIAKREFVESLGFAPRGPSAQTYHLENHPLSLIATAEITLGSLHAGEVLPADSLPRFYAGVSHCFRTEAGAAGRESRGLYRVHQFTKVEMFAFTLPTQSEAAHERLLAIEERLHRQLEIPYRVVDVCTGDLGAPAWRKFDLEAWMPGRNLWGEVTSVSNCTDYQARRLQTRYRGPGRQHGFVHMLNGTALAVSRVLIALVENGQQADRSVRLPARLGLASLTPKC